MKAAYQFPQVALVGRHGSGRSQLLAAISPRSRRPVQLTPRLAGQLGRVRIDDQRLEDLAADQDSQKITPVEVEFSDCQAGLGMPGHLGEWFGSLVEFDLIAAVIGLFADADPVTALDAAVAAVRDELALWDLELVERRLQRLEVELGRSARSERDQLQRENELFGHLASALENGQAISGLDLGEWETRRLRGFALLTAKPFLVIANTADSAVATWPQLAAGCGWPLVATCAQLEAEAAELEPDERVELLSEFGICESSIDQRLANSAAAALGLKYCYTGNRKEARAWALGPRASALDMARAIHSDVEKGFVRAEVLSVTQLIECGSLARARQLGLLRREGKSYQLADGEYVSVLFTG